jgi:hypothetical protein
MKKEGNMASSKASNSLEIEPKDTKMVEMWDKEFKGLIL